MTVDVNIAGVWKDVTELSANVSGVWKNVPEAWVNNGGVWRRVFPSGESAVCPAPGNYEPLLISGGGSSGGGFDMDGFQGCGITAAAAKIGYEYIPGIYNQSMNVNGSPSGTFYRSITVDGTFTQRTIFHDLGATAAAEMESGAATGYSLSGTATATVASSRLRVTI